MDIFNFFTILHIIGTAIGAGGATFSDMLFFQTINDGHISKHEYRLLNAASRLVWAGIALLIASGIGFLILYAYDPGYGAAGQKFFAKMCIVGAVLINGIFMHLKIFPLMRQHAEEDKRITEEPLVSKHTIVITSGVISVTSWYSALILGAWRNMPASFWQIIIVYLILLIGGIIIARFLGKKYISRLKRNK